MKVTYKEFDEVLKTLKFKKKESNKTVIYSNAPFEVVIKLPLPKSSEDFIKEGILSGHAFMLQEKGVIKSEEVLFKILENQRFIRENVLV